MSLDERLENWAACWRSRLHIDQAASIEGAYSSPQRRHWDSDLWVGTAPACLPPLDHPDANEIETAVCVIDLFHHILLKAWYIRRIGVQGALIMARRAAAWPIAMRLTTADAEREINARLLLAKALVDAQLHQPAVIRKQRATQLAREFLFLPALDDSRAWAYDYAHNST